MVESTPNWRIVTWNIRGNHSPDTALIARMLDDFDADVIALQEVRRLQARSVARRLGMSHVWAFKHNPYTALLPFHAEGHAILTRHRIIDSSTTLIGTPVPRRSFRRRIALSADVSRSDSTVHVIDTHLASHDDSDERMRQARAVRALVEAMPSTSVVAGDLNDHNEAAVVDTIAADSHRDAWTVAVSRSPNGLTNPTQAPFQRLDHVLVPAAWTVDSVRVPTTDHHWEMASDHLPVLVVCSQMRSK